MCSVWSPPSVLIHGLNWYVYWLHSGLSDFSPPPLSLSLLQPGDSYDRVKEGVVRTMMAGWLSGIEQDQEQHKQWVNPNEVYTSVHFTH